MKKCSKLLLKAVESPESMRFSELCRLAVCWGYEFKGQKGAHRKYKHERLRLPKEGAMFILQPDRDGNAKPYQVKQVTTAIDYIESEFPDYRTQE